MKPVQLLKGVIEIDTFHEKKSKGMSRMVERKRETGKRKISTREGLRGRKTSNPERNIQIVSRDKN
jgi:hypothetical protein